MNRFLDDDDPAIRWKEEFARVCESLSLRIPSYSLRLHDILKRLYNLHELSLSDIRTLENDRQYAVLAVYAEKRFERDGWRGHLNEASKWWRRADRPEEALRRARRSIQSSNREVRAFGYTTGAAALLDREQLAEAEAWAHKAIEQDSKDPHPYNVLGRLHKKRGNIERSTTFFEEARRLGWAGE